MSTHIKHYIQFHDFGDFSGENLSANRTSLSRAISLLLHMAAGAETSGPFKDLSGEFVLDKEKSDSIQPFLKEVGAPWIARKVSFDTTPTFLQTPLASALTRASFTGCR